MGEHEEHIEMLGQLREWKRRWTDVNPSFTAEPEARRAILQMRQSVITFSDYEGPFLPSRVLFRRMWEMDDRLIRRIYQGMSETDRAILDAEVEASVKKHGSVPAAHRARLIRELHGIPAP